MNDQIQSTLRHVLTTAGGILIAKGKLEAEAVEIGAGVITGLIGWIWGLLSKRRKPAALPIPPL